MWANPRILEKLELSPINGFGQESHDVCLCASFALSDVVQQGSRPQQYGGETYDLDRRENFVRFLGRWDERESDREQSSGKSQARQEQRHWFPTRHTNHVRSRCFPLELEHCGKYEQIRDEIGDDPHAHQNIVCTFDAGARLTEEDEQ